MKERKRKGLDVRCEENEDVEEEAGCSKDVKKRQVSKSMFDNWQRKYEKEHQTQAWLRCELDKRTTRVKKLPRRNALNCVR